MVKKSPPEVVSMIAALTDHRDIDLLESSLLKTVHELLNPDWASIYHLGNDEMPEYSLGFRNGAITRDDPGPAFSDLVSGNGITAFPILSQSREILGYLLVKREPALSPDEQRLMTGMFRIYDNYLTVLRESQIDRLTGLLNRNTFDAQLDRALGLIRQACLTKDSGEHHRKTMNQTGSFWLGEIDIDHFKKINDNFGHLYGDEVLLIVARILQSNFRKTDLIYRFGGEEFVVIVYVEDRADAEMSFERLRRAIENHAFPQVGRVTISVGVTPIHEGSIPVELLGQADQALYHAKSNGRNQVCFYDTLVRELKITRPTITDDFTLFAEG